MNATINGIQPIEAYSDFVEHVKSIKDEVTVPVILFPGNLTGISKYADAIFFMSLLNSSSPYWITGAQAIAAPIIKKIGIEPISMAYIIIAPGGTAGYMGYANLIPRDKTKIAVAEPLPICHIISEGVSPFSIVMSAPVFTFKLP